MKRKRGPGKCKQKKLSVVRAGDISVDPGYYSDINEENNGIESRTEIETREVNTNLSGQRVGLDTPVTNNKTVGGAAAKLAWAITSSRTNLTSDRVPLQRERVGQKEPKSSHGHPGHNKQDLDAAQSVIKKIMKMDAAVPFNAPVDPIALEIPDYFDIIDTPMDFGTICSKLENGLKYRNSEEVLNDVQLIWDNCSKYNKKGSYIVELMERVKNNFMKQWTAAGLYKEQQTVNNGHLSHNPQVLAEPTVRREETEHRNHVRSTISRSAYLQEHDWSQRQHQQLSNCCSHSFKPQQISCCSHTQHDLAPRDNHFTGLQPVDFMNGKSCSQWGHEAGPSLMHSSRPSPSCSFMGPPKQRPFMNHLGSSQLPPSQVQSVINAESAGQLHLPRREHAFSSARDADNGYHPQQYQVDPVHMHAYQPSASCMPVHQPNQCASHQFQSSHVDGGRNMEFAGNLHIPPPTESTADCTKHGTEYPQAPVTDKTTCQNLNQINSTPEQSSSSMANNEACPSPSERLHSTAVDKNFSKRKTRGQGLVQCQEQLSPMMNGQEHNPQGDTSQVKTVSPQSRPQPPTADFDKKRKKASRGRGPTIDIAEEGERIPITTNAQGQPVGPQAQKLTTFLGTLARNGHYLPLTYLDWRAVPIETKEKMWEKVQLRFDIDPMSKDLVLQSLSLRWKDWKSKLKIAHYYPYETDEERLADRDERVLPDQWAALIKLWSTELMQKRSARNRANRMQAKYIHATGRKSFARIREEQKANRPDGKELSRAELFILTRTGKNGKPTNEAASEVIKQLRNRAKDQNTLEDNNKQGDVLSEIIGPDKLGRTRCIELGPAPYDLGGLKPAAKKMVSEANSEIREMKEKMAVMEQTCAQMASQMAAMTSMMSSMHKNSPNENAADTAAFASAASDHSVPQLPHTKQNPLEGSTRQTRSKRKI
ncbi:hypothetical protein BUALT_Bualt15G0089300 [Buddleja alternifolia]|uniref:Bromo domain-containing protein n=1 Tax=Buddleja alternifolia TaxID=168488 RepID=A0AAV6WKC3_9LAMI|nr:hypothetical protein BUALT_Bualt15G0089300 [Buddleja alternifolia]